jgi:D-alanine-D-alanine ligase
MMRIGLTYDLRETYLNEGYTEEETAEFDKAETIEAIEAVLQRSGYATDRIGHVRELVNRLAKGDRWDLVFNIAEGMFGIGREAQVPSLLDAYEIPYTFSDPMVLAVALHKGMTKRIVRDAGLVTPDFALVDSPDAIATVDLPYPLYVKPVSEGTGKGIDATSKAGDREGLETACKKLLTRYPCLIVERYLPGREFTVGIVGTGYDARSLGVMEVMFTGRAEAHGYSYLNKEDYPGRVNYRIVDDDLSQRCAALALASWRVLNCRDGGRVDIRLDEHGEPSFIEVNPLAGLNPIHSDLPIICRLTGVSYEQLISEIMKSALKRIKSKTS